MSSIRLLGDRYKRGCDFCGLLETIEKHIVMKRFAVLQFLFASALMISSCGTSTNSSISGEQEFILETPYPDDPNDQSFHRAIATETEDGLMLVSDWGRCEFDSLMIRIKFSIDYYTKVGQEIPMEHCFFGYPASSNSDDFTFALKSGHVYLKSKTDNKLVLRFMNTCFTLRADKDYHLNGDLSFDISI